MTGTPSAALLVAALVLGACSGGSGDAAPAADPSLASYSLSADLGNDFTGNHAWIRGTRSVAADGKYPCLSEFQVCVPLDQAGRTDAVQDLCPSTDTPEGTWTFEFYLASDEACAAPLGNLYCEIQRGEWLQPGSNANQVRCTTQNAEKTFEFCVYDPATGAGLGQCGTSVLLVAADFPEFVADVQAKQLGTGAFTKVDWFDASDATPTVAQLLEYDSVLVWSNYVFADRNALGDNLATFFEAGGRVVSAVFANADADWMNGMYAIGGRFATDYLLIEPAEYPTDPAALGTIDEPGSPLLADVTSLEALVAYRSTGGVRDGGVVVARWSDGTPLVVRGTFAPGNRVDLNLFPVSRTISDGYWSGGGAELIRNALLYR
jgi:hypothetical protein